MLLKNEEKGKFTKQPLPVTARFSGVNGIVTDDLNGDGHADLLLSAAGHSTRGSSSTVANKQLLHNHPRIHLVEPIHRTRLI